MIVFYIYLQSNLSFDDLANVFRKIINCNSSNQTKGQIEQIRYGENYGGKYYLMEACGIEFKLIKNTGEVIEEDFSQYQYYLLCHCIASVNDTYVRGFILYVAELLRIKGIHNVSREL